MQGVNESESVTLRFATRRDFKKAAQLRCGIPGFRDSAFRGLRKGILAYCTAVLAFLRARVSVRHHPIGLFGETDRAVSITNHLLAPPLHKEDIS